MQSRGKHRILIDLEKLNTLNAEGCPACGRKFSLGDQVVLARGKWQGLKYVHGSESVFDKKSDTHYERRYYAAKRKI